MSAPPEVQPEVQPGTLLGGRVRYAQFAAGYRTGIEPVLLAAAVPARPGARVIEAGCGAGAALLCLAARVAGVTGIGIEADPALAALAARNAQENGFADRIGFVPAEIERAGAAGAAYDHALANPPWHDPAGPASPDQGRDRAKRAAPGLLAAWVGALARALRPGGTLSLILPSGQLEGALAACAAHRIGALVVFPLWPRAGRAAKLIILQGRRGGRAALVIAAGLVLHEGAGFSAAAEAVLRGGAAIDPRG